MCIRQVQYAKTSSVKHGAPFIEGHYLIIYVHIIENHV